MFKKIFLASLVAGALSWGLAGNVFAKGDMVGRIPIEKLDELAATPASGADYIPVYDASANKDKRLDVARFQFADAVNGEFEIGTDTYGLSAHSVTGTGTLSLVKFTTYVISNAAGAAQDIAFIPDGTTAGQQKRVVLGQDNETSGTVIAPATAFLVGGAGTGILLEDAGDSVTLEWSGSTGWVLVSNVGGTVQ